MTQPDPLADARAFMEAQRREYGRYKALVPITVGNNVLAYNPGDPIPVSNYEAARQRGDYWADGDHVQDFESEAPPTPAPTPAADDSVKTNRKSGAA